MAAPSVAVLELPPGRLRADLARLGAVVVRAAGAVRGRLRRLGRQPRQRAASSAASPTCEFIAPGMIASTAMQVAVGESTWPVLARFKWIRIYHAMPATPLRVGDDPGRRHAVHGCSGSSRRRPSSCCVTALFGALHSWWALLVPLIAALVGLAFAAPIVRADRDGRDRQQLRRLCTGSWSSRCRCSPACSSRSAR